MIAQAGRGRPCGAYAHHVDHIDPREGRRDSALKPTGSTRSWRRLRLLVLERDGWACQVLLDPLTDQVLEAPRPTTPPLGPDDPAWLRAACADHNLSRGASTTDARPTTRTPDQPTSTRWDW